MPDIDPDFFNSLGDTAKKLLIPALAAAAGTGALSGYVASKHRPGGETPSMRRKRILRNALFGSALGGTATMALPLGLKTMASRLSEDKAPIASRAMDSAGNLAMSNAGGLAGGGAVGFGVWKNLRNSRNRAEGKLMELLKGKFQGNQAKSMGALLNPDLKTRMGILDYLTAELGQKGHGRFRANELLGEAGYPAMTLADMQRAGVRGVDKQYRRFVGSQGRLGQMLASRTLPEHMPLLEAYNRLARNSARSISGRMNPLAAAGLIGGGALAGNWLQDKFTGN